MLKETLDVIRSSSFAKSKKTANDYMVSTGFRVFTND